MVYIYIYNYILENVILSYIKSDVQNSQITTDNNLKYDLLFGSYTHLVRNPDSRSTVSGIIPIQNSLGIIEKAFKFF